MMMTNIRRVFPSQMLTAKNSVAIDELQGLVLFSDTSKAVSIKLDCPTELRVIATIAPLTF
jgi:hypothetical protein